MVAANPCDLELKAHQKSVFQLFFQIHLLAIA